MNPETQLEDPTLQASSTKPNSNLKILVVEDDNITGTLIIHTLDQLKAHFPNAQIVLVKTWLMAMVSLCETPRPNIALLDLSLPDSDWHQTIDHIPMIENECPVVIVTGHSEAEVEKLLRGKNVQVVQKGGAGLEWADKLITAMMRAIDHWHAVRYAKIAEGLNIMKALNEKYATPEKE